jgi:hypothetical protein
LGPVYKRAPRQAAAVIGTSSKLDKSMIGTCPNPSPAVAEVPNRILDWDPKVKH